MGRLSGRVGLRFKVAIAFIALAVLPPVLTIAGGAAYTLVFGQAVVGTHGRAGAFLSVWPDDRQPVHYTAPNLALVALVIYGGTLTAGAALLLAVLARGVIDPARQLITAIEHMGEGDLDYALAPSRSGDGEMAQLVEAFETMRQRLRDSLLREAAAEQQRRELLAAISHDLRTPLTSISGYVAGLRDGVAQGEEDVARYLGVIEQKVGRLNRLIDDLFSLSRLEAGDFTLDRQRYDARRLLDELLQPWGDTAAARDVAWTVALPAAGEVVWADRQRLGQVLDNILDNAFRHTPHGGAVSIAAARSGDMLQVIIRDNGPGIAAADLPHVFDFFYRGDRARAGGGTGLGLPIARRLLELHGGTLDIESRDGTQVTLRLPMEGRT